MSERERFEAWARTQPRHEGASMRFLALNNAYIDFDLHGAWLAWQAARSGQAASGSSQGARSDERTGWPPGLLQDDSRELSRALASKPDAMAHARDAVAKIGQPEAPTAAALVRDAARYRFLRDNDKRHFWPPVHGSMWVVVYHQPPGVHAMPETRVAGYGADLDVAIDAAIAAARSGAGSEEGGAT